MPNAGFRMGQACLVSLQWLFLWDKSVPVLQKNHLTREQHC